MTEPSPRDTDPVIKHLRDEVSEADRQLIELVNRRLRLVAQLKRYKESRGIGFLDPEREEWMLSYLQRANRGPLSSEGLEELFSELLALTKREVARVERRSPGT
jgi:chorismate mutase